MTGLHMLGNGGFAQGCGDNNWSLRDVSGGMLLSHAGFNP